MNRLKPINGFHWERIDAVTLRGKETEVELFSVAKAHTGYSSLAL
jgi:adenylate cyclase